MSTAASVQRDAARLFELIGAKWTTQAVGVAAELGIADELSQGPRGIEELALATGCDPAALRRLMRALAGVGVCAERADLSYELTEMGALLKAGAEPSLRSWAVWTARYQWNTWARLIDSVRTGQSARKLATGRDGYAYLEGDTEAAAVFNRAMVEMTRLVAGSVARSHDFSSARLAIDVGGGYGELVSAVLAEHAHLRGIVFDLPHAMQGALARIKQSGLGARCEFAPGSFFDALPAGADVHLLKSILHNWPDERCAAILRVCRAALPAGGRVLVIERVMPERITGSELEHTVLRGDLNMLVGLGGRERTLGELDTLLTSGGFAITSCEPLTLGYRLIEGLAC
jgi:orsellinic acid C2-O-methyltransferase